MSPTATIEQPRTADATTRTLILLAGWFFLAVWLGVSGRFNAHGAPPFGIAAALALPLIAFAVDRRAGGPLFGGFLRLQLPTLIRLQTPRVVGVVFIVAWAGGTLPAGFALPAGIGDIAVGLAAPFVAAAVAQRRPHHLLFARLWNILGTADLIIAVSSGVLHGRSPIGLLAGSIPTDGVARYPMSLIPTFLVPIALMLHISAFRALATSRRD
jgi:hypothetical protein